MKEQLNTLETQGNPAPVSSASIGALQVCMKVTVNAVMIFDSDPCTNLFRFIKPLNIHKNGSSIDLV